MWIRLIRVLKHRWLDDSAGRQGITPDMVERLKQRVKASEGSHTGEVRIVVESALPSSYLWRAATVQKLARQRALTLFGKLRIWDTEHNNGVLIYLLLAEQLIEIVADRGLNPYVPVHHWQGVIQQMRQSLQQGAYEEGLTLALQEVSAVLVRHFPLAEGAPHHNQLPDRPLID
jgi:uncharacterized membrane protein